MPAGGFYAVANGRKKGIFHTWDECKAQVDGFPGAKFKKFKSEAEAKAFVGTGSTAVNVPKTQASSLSQAPSLVPTKKRTLAQDASSGSRKRKVVSSTSKSSPASAASAAAPGPTLTNDGMRIIDVYTDGASSSNGQAGARAGWGVHWPEGARDPTSDLHGLDESRRLEGALQTNNRAELMAIIRAVELCPDPAAQLRIYSDSKYCIDAMTDWQHTWRRNGWRRGKGSARTAVLNRDLIRKLERLMRARTHRPILVYVKGHGTSEGNNEADRLAVAGATLPDIPKEQWQDFEPPPSDDENGNNSAFVDEEAAHEANRKRAKAAWVKAGFTLEEAEERSDKRAKS